MNNEPKTYLEVNSKFLVENAKKVLKKAKEQEAKKMNAGKKYVQIDAKTRVLR